MLLSGCWHKTPENLKLQVYFDSSLFTQVSSTVGDSKPPQHGRGASQMRKSLWGGRQEAGNLSPLLSPSVLQAYIVMPPILKEDLVL